jgi:hypothetical protein
MLWLWMHPLRLTWHHAPPAGGPGMRAARQALQLALPRSSAMRARLLNYAPAAPLPGAARPSLYRRHAQRSVRLCGRTQPCCAVFAARSLTPAPAQTKTPRATVAKGA